MKKLILVLGVSALCLPATASAHFNLVAPPQASKDTGGGKGAPPCGPDTAPAATPTAVQGGHPLAIMINETVQHTGFYRFALALNSISELPPDNTVYSGPNMTGMILPVNGTMDSKSAAIAATAVFPVLADGMYQHTAATPNVTLALPRSSDPPTILLPNVTCASCTLQVIEFMQDHPANPGGGYFYHHCATLKITADPSMPLFTPGGGGASSGGSGGAASSGGAGGSGGTGAGGTVAAGGTGAAVAGAGGSGGTIGIAGASSSGGGSGGAAPIGAGGQTSAGAGVAGMAVTGAAGAAPGAAPADSGGCSLSSSKRSAGAASWTAVMLGLLAFGRRRRARR